ncbi:MAG TPA: hypothetical protein VFF73_20510 [Planctomycetota bacterium]|nr:hypothetical protein [Planctomycetota bacterium]
MTPDEDRPRALVRSLAVTFLYVAPAILASWRLLDPDIFWHLRTGQWIADHGCLPGTDAFSAFGAGKPWVAYSWVFELIVYGLYRAAGWAGILAFRSVMWVVISIALHRLVARRQPSFIVGWWITAVAIAALLGLCEPRPWLLTMLFFIIELDLVDGAPDSRAMLALPAIFALWANVHVQFVYGLFVLVVYALEPLLVRAVAFVSGSPERPPLSRRLLAVTAASIVATLVSPYHVHVYNVVHEYATQTLTFQLITELAAMPFRIPSDWCVLALTVGAALAMGWRHERRPARYVVFAVATYCAFRAMRDVWFVTIVSALLLACARVSWLPDAPMRSRRLPLAFTALIVAAGLLDIGFVHARINAWSEAWIRLYYPADAAAEIERKGYEGPLYNPFNWGGYLIWRLPERPVSMDGRTNLHGPERIARNIITYSGGPGWAEDTELAHARIVITRNGRDALRDLLRNDPRFELAWVDSTATVFVARGAKK